MKLTETESTISVEIDPNAESFCEKEGVKMVKHLTALFPNDPTIQNASKYKTWNIGKLAVWYWLRRLEKEKLLRIVRTPFKDEYKVHDDIDDLVVVLMRNGVPYHLEVRTRSSDIPPALEQSVHMDCIKPMVIYVFVIYNPKTYQAQIVGWANWEVLKSCAIEMSCCGDEEKIVHIPGEFAVYLKDMKSIQDAVKWTKGL